MNLTRIGIGFLILATGSALHAASPYRIMPVGDSITVGYTDNSKWTVPYQFGYRSGLYTRLTNSGTVFQYVGNSPEPWNGTSGTPTNIPTLDLRTIGQDHCEGYSGKTTAYIAANIAAWLAIDSPDIVLLQIGINDISKGATAEPTTAETNLYQIITTIVSNAPNARVIVAQITPYSTYTDALAKYNTYIRNTLVPGFMAQGKYVTTVNQYTNLLVAGTTNIDTSLYANGINHPNAVGYDRMAQTWFNGIQALTPFAPQPPIISSNLLTNGSFEVPVFANNNSHNVNPSGSGWTWTAGVTGAGTGIDRGDQYGSSGSAPVAGAQQAFLQSSGNSTTSRISQAVSGFTVGQYYQLAFYSKAIMGFQGANPFQVRFLNGAVATPLFGGNDIVPITNNYTFYQSEPFVASNTVLTLEFADHALSTVQKVSWIDSVSISQIPPVSLSGTWAAGRFQVQFAGVTNLSYSTLAATNLALPLSNWTWLGSAAVLSNGVFQFTDSAASNYPNRFYRVSSP